MEYFNIKLILQMVLLGSLNVQLFLKIRSCMISPSQTRQERFGTIHIIVSSRSSSKERLKMFIAQRPNTVMVFAVHL